MLISKSYTDNKNWIMLEGISSTVIILVVVHKSSRQFPASEVSLPESNTFYFVQADVKTAPAIVTIRSQFHYFV